MAVYTANPQLIRTINMCAGPFAPSDHDPSEDDREVPDPPSLCSRLPARALFPTRASWDQYSLVSQPVPVKELGGKVRIVSKSDAYRVLISERYREPWLNSLRQFRSVRLPLDSDEERYPIRPLRCTCKKKCPVVVYSADLSAATDLISHDVLRQVAAERKVPWNLVSGGTLNGSPLVRGTLMGIPCSWTALTEIHLRAILDMFHTRLRVLESLYLKGDDLIALWSTCLVQRYESELPIRTGMTLNKQKSFVSPTRGLFCEKAYVLTMIENRAYLVRDSHSVSLRALANSAPDWQPRGFSINPQPAANLAAVPYLLSRRRHIGHKRAAQLCSLVAARLLRKARQRKIEPFLPLQLGGLGLLPSKATYSFSKEIACALTGLHNLVPQCVEYFRSRHLVTMPGDSLEGLVARRMRGPVSKLRPTWDAKSERVEWTEALFSKLTAAYAVYALVEELPSAGARQMRSHLAFCKSTGRHLMKLHPMREPPVVTYSNALALAQVRWYLPADDEDSYPFSDEFDESFSERQAPPADPLTNPPRGETTSTPPSMVDWETSLEWDDSPGM